MIKPRTCRFDVLIRRPRSSEKREYGKDRSWNTVVPRAQAPRLYPVPR